MYCIYDMNYIYKYIGMISTCEKQNFRDMVFLMVQVRFEICASLWANGEAETPK